MGVPTVRKNSNVINTAVKIKGLEFGGTSLMYVTVPCFSVKNCGTGYFNLLTPNDDYSGRTAPLTSICCISYIYSTKRGTEYFKHGIYSPFFLFKIQFVS